MPTKFSPPNRSNGSKGAFQGLFTRLATFTLLGFCFWSCLERNNPFDPQNQKTGFSREQVDAVIKGNRPILDSLAMEALQGNSALVDFQRAFQDASRRNADLAATHEEIREHNRVIVAFNDAAAAQNAQSPDSFTLKRTFEFLAPYTSMESAASLESTIIGIKIGKLRTDSLIHAVNGAYQPHRVYSQAFQDSLHQVFDTILVRLEALDREIKTEARRLEDSNTLVVNPYNELQGELNRQVRLYNESHAYRGQPLIAVKDSLAKAALAAGPGDTLRIAGGLFEMRLDLANSGTEDQPLVIMGDPGMTTVLTSSSKDEGILFLSQKRHIRFYNLVFRESSGSGVKMEAQSRHIWFHGCHFLNNDLHGVEVVDSEVFLKDCSIAGNKRSGIRVSSDLDILRIENVLIANNNQWGIDAVSAACNIQRSTIADNGLDGIKLSPPLKSASISNSIIAFNSALGINSEPTGSNAGLLSLNACNIFGNVAGEVEAGFQTDFLRHDPFFATKGLSYVIGVDSELARLEKQGIVIGYRVK